jgi:hypothetical protein
MMGSQSASQGIPSLIWNCKIPPLVPTLNEMNSVHDFQNYFSKIILLVSYHLLDLLSDLLTSDFLTKILFAFLISSMHAVCSTHLMFLDLITLKYLVKRKVMKLLIM